MPVVRFPAIVLIGWMCLLIYHFHTATRPTLVSSRRREEGWGPANSTLGFGAVAPVSRAGSTRREGLIFAANITGVDLTIPAQPQWSDDDVAGVRARNGSTLTRGSALAWLGHLNALKWFLSTGLGSALILEDDVDWDIHLRSTQVPAAAAGVRLLERSVHDEVGHHHHHHHHRHGRSDDYWGSPGDWDLLYLGHCGDFFSRTTWQHGRGVPHVTFPDPTMPRPADLHPYTQKFLESVGLPRQNRLVHKTTFPLCTFGYAVSRASAQRLVRELAAREPDGGCVAYDVRIHEICRDTPDFTCWTVNPELMHHVDAASEIGRIDAAPAAAVGEPDPPTRRPRRQTPNIACGARTSALYTRDPDVLAYLETVAADEKSCLPPDVETLERDMKGRRPSRRRT